MEDYDHERPDLDACSCGVRRNELRSTRARARCAAGDSRRLPELPRRLRSRECRGVSRDAARRADSRPTGRTGRRDGLNAEGGCGMTARAAADLTSTLAGDAAGKMNLAIPECLARRGDDDYEEA